MSQKITQERVRFLKYDVGEDLLFELVASGLSLEEIARAVDPTGIQGIWKFDLSRFLGGRKLDRTGPSPDTLEVASRRRIRYRQARLDCATREHLRKFPPPRDGSADYLAALRGWPEYYGETAGVLPSGRDGAPGMCRPNPEAWRPPSK